MSNLLVLISVRDKHDEGIKKMCSTGISLGRSKLLQSCSNFTLKPGRSKTNCNNLFSRQRCSGGLHTGFVHTPLLSLFASQAGHCSVLCDHPVLDEVRPKVLCIHTKLIIVCRRLRAVKK